MPSLSYESIYKKALTMINDLELATYTEDDFYDILREWLQTTSSLPLLRKKFSSYSLDDEIMTLTFTLNNSVDDEFDKNFVKTILAKGIIINYFPSKLESTKNLATMIGGKEEKVLINTYSKNIERLTQLEREWERDLSRHSYYFSEYGGTNG
ncbi:hypothetical protein [uncultured Eubacterium sp.]|uniref:hypothetical protein n=1 Tax=uncultured Eubacterium sp. TaxID=165185 RepID=UPI002595E4B0|nr:hypothetical protein [uncultured Eubacterium sp.]